MSRGKIDILVSTVSQEWTVNTAAFTVSPGGAGDPTLSDYMCRLPTGDDGFQEQDNLIIEAIAVYIPHGFATATPFEIELFWGDAAGGGAGAYGSYPIEELGETIPNGRLYVPYANAPVPLDLYIPWSSYVAGGGLRSAAGIGGQIQDGDLSMFNTSAVTPDISGLGIIGNVVLQVRHNLEMVTISPDP